MTEEKPAVTGYTIEPTPLIELVHDAPCELWWPENWRQASTGLWSPADGITCTCPPDAVEEKVEQDYTPAWNGALSASESQAVPEKKVESEFHCDICGSDEHDALGHGDDLPHPGISDEFWAEIPDADRVAFSAFLVNQAEQQAAIDAIDKAREVHREGLTTAGGWCAPYDVLYPMFPDVTVRRGGIQFTSGPDLDALLKKRPKKELIERIGEYQKLLAKERKRRYKAERKVKRLLKIIERNL